MPNFYNEIENALIDIDGEYVNRIAEFLKSATEEGKIYWARRGKYYVFSTKDRKYKITKKKDGSVSFSFDVRFIYTFCTKDSAIYKLYEVIESAT